MLLTQVTLIESYST